MERVRCRLFPFVTILSAVFFIESVEADLEFGTFFGANWVNVEDKIRKDFRSNLLDVRSYCSADAICSTEKRRFCGYKDEVFDRFDQFSFSSGNNRHLLDPKCYLPILGPSCFQDICFEECFRDNVHVSRGCNVALTNAKTMYNFLREVEDVHDQREAFFRRSIMSMVLLSALAGVLVIILTDTTPVPGQEMQEESGTWTGRCGKLLTVTNWIMVVTLLGFVTVVCPVFLVVLVPPFLLVHAIKYCILLTCNERQIVETSYVSLKESELSTALLAVPVQVA